MDSMENRAYWADYLQRNTSWGRAVAVEEARCQAEQGPKKISWLQRATGLNFWEVLLWAAFAVYVVIVGIDASKAIYSKPEWVRTERLISAPPRDLRLRYSPLPEVRPSVPTIINGGQPSGGRLLNWEDGKTYRIDDLRGDWTLIVFAAYSCYEHSKELLPIPALECLQAQKEHYASLNRALDYFHKKLSPLGVKVWVVRIDYMFKQPPGFVPLPGTEPPEGPMDRYLLARMVKDGNMLRMESSPARFRDWMIDQWLRLSHTRQDGVGGDTAPYFALLDPKGYIRFMEARTSNIAIVKGVYQALGRHLRAAPAPDLAIEEEDQARLGMLDMSDLYGPVDRKGKPQGGVRKSLLADKYVSLFGTAQALMKRSSWRLVPCLSCDSVLLDPAMYLLFGVKPEGSNGDLPDRQILPSKKDAGERAKALAGEKS